MNAEQKEKAHDLFLLAIELDALERQSYIQKHCQGDKKLEQYVLDLLSNFESSDNYFNKLEEDINATQMNEIEQHLFGERLIGNYKILNVMKQGGMGTVFLAERADGEFERKVVIKMLPFDLNYAQSRIQFAHEKEILASLVHPNIVQLYDAGIAENGEPYFVMELIEGKTLIDHCNENQLGFKARLKLFDEVLQALIFAHQHMIIHGDIKPSNIMVNEEGQIRLLDFGIAQLLYNKETKSDSYSLNYLTPEHQNNQSINTMTDIHQLGQLLLELITNVAPELARSDNFEFQNLQDFIIQGQRKHQHSQASLGQDIKSINKVYHSDLRFIVAKCLNKKPQNRYKMVQGLQEDLKLYHQSRCINAREKTHIYRLFQYIKRNKLLSVMVTSIVFISFVFSWQLNRHNQQLTTERDKAITVKNLMTDVFNSADPSYAIGKELSATEVLDMGLQQVRSRFKEHSEIEADLLQEIAITYQNLGNYHKSQEILKEVYAIRLALFPNDAYEKAKGLLLLGENATLMSENKQAKEWLLESLEIFEKDQLNYSADIISAKSKLGSVMVLLGEIKQAEIMLDSATELTLSLYGNQSFEYAQALNDLSSVYFRQGQYQQVQDLLIKTKGIREKILASKKASLFDKDYATNINNLGLAYYLQGDLPMGEKYFKQAHSLRAEIYTKAHPEQAQSLTNLGLLLNDAGRPEEAFTYLEKALKVRQATLVPGHMRINDAWNNLAMVHHEIGDFIQAEEIYAKLMQTIIEAKGEKHPQSLSIMTNRGNTLLELLSFQQAHDLFHRSLKIRLETLPSDHLYLSYNYVGLGRAKIALTDVEEGINLIEKAIKIRKEKLPPDHWLLGESLYALAMANFVQGSQDFDATNTACGILKNTKGNENHLTKKCLKLLQKIKDTPL